MSLTGSTNEEMIWNFLLGKGLNSCGVAGLMGNLYAESGLKPTNLQNSYEKKLGLTDDQYTTSVDNGDYANFVKDSAGYGLAQWTYWSRKQNLLNFVRSRNKSIGDMESQLEFLWKELSEGYKTVLGTLKTAKTVLEASSAVLTGFEKPANQGLTVQAKRAEYGQSYYNRYAKKTTNAGGSKMSNSSLVNCTVQSPNHSGARTHKIDRITPHCVVGQLSAESIGGCFTSSDRQASCNYGIGTDGRVVLCVDEGNRSWCSSSNANDQRAVTIECASDKTEPYAMNSSVYNKLVQLCVDICKRNGISKLLWLRDKDTALAYEPKDGEAVLTAHRWFANKSCPGEWLYSRFGDLANAVNASLGGSSSSSTPSSGTLYRVQAGAFGNKNNAVNQYNAIKAAGFDAILVQVNGMYKIQVGAYGVKANADAMLAKIKAAGFDAFITTQGGTQVSTAVESDPAATVQVGSTVRLNSGAKTYTGGSLAGFVYNRDHVVKEINGDRAVITYNGAVVAAVHVSDLTLA